MSDPSIKKRTKKRRKKAKGASGEAGAADSQPNGQEKVPKQSSDISEELTTTRCHRCKGTFRQMVQNGGTASSIQQANWMCPSCVQAVKAEEEKQKQRVNSKEGGTGECNCDACVAKRENAVTPQVERDAHLTQTYWMEIRHIVKKIYREKLSLTNPTHKANIGSDKMKMIVKKLCNKDPHQFFQRLETLAREYLLEVKVRLLEQLSCGFNSPQLAIEFIQMLLEEYSYLCNSLPSLLYLLEPLEECDYVQKLGMTVELMNKNIFRELIFAESFMSSNLPLIIAQLRLASLSSDHYHRTTADNLSQRYVALDHEMDEISRIWKAAKDHLNHQQDAHRKLMERRAQIKADGDSFKQRQTGSARGKELGVSTTLAQTKERERKKSSECTGKQSSSIGNESNSKSTFPNGRSHSHSGLIASSDSVTSEQAALWSKELFKCVKPVGEPEFRLNGDIATHTITLHVDMTSLDLSSTKACCKRHDLQKFRRLGFTVDEVVEVAVKLNALRSMGVHLSIEDLFDDEGFSLCDINRTLLGEDAIQQQDSAYFLDDGSCDSDDDLAKMNREKKGSSSGGGDGISVDDDTVDLQRARQMILLRQETTNGRNRQQDFLQGITMKIRFMKRLTVEDLDKNFVADGGRVMFSSCDQVQMKLTQLELNTSKLATNGECLGDDLGLDVDGIHNDAAPIKRVNQDGCTEDDYLFIHTDSHKKFMELLLEKRKKLESDVTAKLKRREKTASEDMPRYHVKDTQESGDSKSQSSNGSKSSTDIGSSSNSGSHGACDGSGGSSNNSVTGFRPLYLPNSTQACHCSACVGAVAANVHPSYRRPLNPTDPNSGSVMIECGLPAVVGGIRGGAKLPAMLEVGNLQATPAEPETKEKSNKKGSAPPLSKEGLWQNWMSTSGSAQLESEANHAHPSGSAHHHHHHHHHGNCNGDTNVANGDGNGKGSCSIPCDCHDNHGSGHAHQSGVGSYRSGCTTDHNHGSMTHGEHGHAHHGPEGGGAGDGSGSGNGEGSRRYCPCCYCELFGHNGPPTAPTSHNYTKRRDKMRAKLDEKKRKEQYGGKGGLLGYSGSGPLANQQTSVEELLAFIEGDEGEGGGSGQVGGVNLLEAGPPSIGGGGGKSTGKKGKKKTKKPQSGGVSSYHSNEGDNGVHQNGIESSSSNKGSNSSLDQSGGSSTSGQHFARGAHSTSSSSKNGNKQQTNGTAATTKKGKKVQGAGSSGKGSSRHHVAQQLLKNDSDDEATPISDLDEEDDFDDYDDELEEFKKFCFAPAPVEARKKIAVSVDMNDIMSKLK